MGLQASSWNLVLALVLGGAVDAEILDIGLSGPDVFARDVAAALNAGNGILWFIDSSL
jgi:hypothetical protein